MTDKLKCCFCGAELEDDWYEYENGRGDTEYAKSGLLKCPDWDCRGYKLKLEPEIWQALISGKKAQDALKHLFQELCYLCMDEKSTKANLYKQINELLIYSYNAIGEITSITKQGE